MDKPSELKFVQHSLTYSNGYSKKLSETVSTDERIFQMNGAYASKMRELPTMDAPWRTAYSNDIQSTMGSFVN